jgi:hypothetical protein
MRSYLKNISLVLGSVTTFLVLLELTLALFAPHKLVVRPYHERYDPVMGWVNKPLKNEGVHFEFAPDRSFHVSHNSLGLRGKETTRDKPPGTKRILFVGDSFFWGYGVSDDEVVSAILQELLPNAYEVINGGTTGFGTDQAYLWLKNEGLTYRPDIVIFGFSAANDLQEISRSVAYFSPKPIFMLENDKLVLKNVPVPRSTETDRKTFGQPRTLFGKLKKFLRYHTHTYQFIVGRLNADPETRLFLINLGLAEEYTSNIGNIPVLTNPPDRVRDIAFRLIKESRRISQDAGASFLLVFIPDKEEDRSGMVAVTGVKEGAYARNSELSSSVQSFAAREKIAFLDLLPFMREQYRQGVSLYNVERYDHHWTALGHERIAGEIIRSLEKYGQLSP